MSYFQTETDPQTVIMSFMVLGRRGGEGQLGSLKKVMYVHIFKMDKLNKDLQYSAGSSAQCHVVACTGRGLGENDICVYMAQPPLAANLRLPQH